MDRFINIFNTENDVNTALENGDLLTPFVTYILDGNYVYWSGLEVDYTKMPLTFEVGSNGTISMVGSKSLEYSTDGGSTWGTLNSSSPINVTEGMEVQFRGNTNGYSSSNHLAATATINKVKGNIMSIYDKDNFETNVELTQPIGGLFYNMTTIIDASNLLLPATTLCIDSYSSMFQGCSTLTIGPALPATTLKNNCYYSMFQGCSSLTTAPELPATTLAAQCYYSMFKGCSSLTTAPELPATTLTSSCYYSMFQSCTSLTTAPELPATTLASQCYYQMFQGCSSLTTAPELPATTLAIYCYDSMFKSCTSLTTAPELPATTLVSDCYNSMFYECRALTTAPTLPATTLVSNCYRTMFWRCTNLNYIKCLAINLSSNYTSQWVYNVSSTGTFVKKAGAEWTTGMDGIPSGWTVQEV